MSVVDARPNATGRPNVHLGVGIDTHAAREYIHDILGKSA
jgi:hypothetical protein